VSGLSRCANATRHTNASETTTAKRIRRGSTPRNLRMSPAKIEHHMDLEPLRKIRPLGSEKSSPRISRMARMVFRAKFFHPCHPRNPWFLLVARGILRGSRKTCRRSIFKRRGAEENREVCRGMISNLPLRASPSTSAPLRLNPSSARSHPHHDHRRDWRA